MDSQETANNAAESGSDRGGNMVKPNAALPSGFRARPQGPPGSPRHPINNGPVGQLRPGGQPQQIRFDGRTPFRPSSSGQFVQLRPYGPPRPPVNSFPQRPPQQGQNPPIVLNPRFAPSSINRPGPQQRLRLPHPGNYQGQQFQRNIQQQPQQFRPLQHQNIPQQAGKPVVLAQPQEIAQKQLQRHESLLNIPEQSLPSQKDEKKPPLPRIVVERMADVDNAKKLKQFENSAPKEMRENTENDDDDDVVMDGNKSQSIECNTLKRDEMIVSKSPNKDNIVQCTKKPESATINGKIDVKSIEDTAMEKMNEKLNNSTANHKLDNPESKTVESAKDSRLSSAKSDESKHPEPSGTVMEKVDNKVGELMEKTIESKSTTKDADSIKECTEKSTAQNESSASPTPTILEDKSNRLDTSQASTQPAKASLDEQNLKTPTKSQIETQSNASEENCQRQNEQKLTLPDSPDKSCAIMPTDASQSRKEQEQKTPSKSVENSHASVTAETNEIKSEQELEAPSKSPDKSRASTPVIANNQTGVNQVKNKEESKIPSKSPDKSRASTPAEANNRADTDQTKSELELKESKSPDKSTTPTHANNSQIEGDLKVQEKSDKSRVNTPIDTNQIQEEQKSKEAISIDATIQGETSDSQREQKLKTTSPDPDKSSAPTEIESKMEQEAKESFPTGKELNDSPKSTASAANEAYTEKSTKQTENVGENSVTTEVTDENLSEVIEDSSKQKISPPPRSPDTAKENNKPSKSPAPPENEEKLSKEESVLSTPKSPSESVKGYDNGQRRSLTPKSSPVSSPQTPVSPKSPKSLTENGKLANNEEKKATFAKDLIDQTKDDDKETPDSKSPSKPSTPNDQETPTAAEMDKKSEEKFTAMPGIQNGNAMDESVQSNMISATNGVENLLTKEPRSKSKEADKRSTAGSPIKSPSKSIKSLPRTPETPTSTATQDKKKLPMNKVQVGSAPSPNLKTVRSKIGSLDNASYKPGGGKVKIENRKLDFSKAQPKIAAKNEKYTPSGGDKKISQVKLQWNAKPKVGSLDNATYKPGGGDKKIETVKLDFKDKAKPKVGSKDNAKHIPGGGSVKSSATPPKTPQDSSNNIQTQKLDIKAESKIGSLDNVKHKPGGGDKKIFNDKDYLRQTGSNVESLSGSGSQINNTEEVKCFSPEQTKEDLPQPPPTTPTKTQKLQSPSSMVTPKAIRNSFAKSSEAVESKRKLSTHKIAKAESEINTNQNLESSKNVTNDKGAKPSTHPPNTFQLKIPDKSTSRTPGKTSPTKLRLPKLAPSPTPQETTPSSDTYSKVSLPKLIEPSTQSTRVAH